MKWELMLIHNEEPIDCSIENMMSKLTFQNLLLFQI